MKRVCLKRLKITLCRAIAVLAVATASAASAAPTIANRAYRYKMKGGEITGYYPALDYPEKSLVATKFNLRVHEFLNEQRKELAKSAKKDPLTLRINFESTITRSGVICILFKILAEDRSMGHAGNQYVPLVINTLLSKEMELEDIFVPGTAWLEELVRIARADLSARNLATTDDWIEKGTAANPGNFSVFRVTDTALEIYFPEYQVAPYGVGLQRVTIPFESLKGLVEPKFLSAAPAN